MAATRTFKGDNKKDIQSAAAKVKVTFTKTVKIGADRDNPPLHNCEHRQNTFFFPF